MKHSLPTRRLPERPNLDQLKRQAKELLESRPGYALHDAQHELARSYGFDSWPKLKAFVDGVNARHLMEAVRAGDIDQVRAMLRLRPELIGMVEAPNNEHTALHYAVLGRMPEMVRLLMQSGADAHAGISPHNDATGSLTMARDRGYDEIVAIILEEENRREPSAEDELVHAIRSADEDRAIAILQREPSLVHARALHAASAMLLPRLAEWLLDHGATPLDVIGGPGEIAALLRAHGAKYTARAAVIEGNTAFLRARHAEGALGDPRERLLETAVQHDRADMLQLLLDLGLDPDQRTRVEGIDEVAFTWGEPLYHCARHGKHAMAEMLLAHRADPNAQVYASGTPLSEAYGQRDEAMIALLERYGGKSNASMAGLYRRPDLARKLLAQYGDQPLPDDGFSSGPVAEQLLGAAARGGDPEILQMAMDRVTIPGGDPRWAGLLTAPMQFWNHWIGPWCHPEWDRGTYLTCFKMILDRCGPLDARRRFGSTILHEVVTTGDHLTPEERTAFATLLLDHGAPLHLRDDLLQSTPLGWAARWGRVELVRLFLARGADPDEPDAEPWATPRAWATRMGHAEVLVALEEEARR